MDNLAIMELALHVASTSPDPSTQNAAILVDSYGIPVCMGVNEFPRGVRCLEERWERPFKHYYVEHAERSVIYHAARLGISTCGLSMISPWAACADCARAIVAAGIYTLITLPREWEEADTSSRWKETVDVGDDILREGKVQVVFLQDPVRCVVPIRRNGHPWRPRDGKG